MKAPGRSGGRRSFFQAVAGLTLVLLSASSAPGFTAELTVGTKVIYPGANGGPPLEKDTGTSLRINVHSSGAPSTSGPSTNGPSERQERLQQLLDDGKEEDLLKATARHGDALSRSFRAMALDRLDRAGEARKEAQSVLQTGMVPPDLLEEITALAGEAASPEGEPGAPGIASPSR